MQIFRKNKDCRRLIAAALARRQSQKPSRQSYFVKISVKRRRQGMGGYAAAEGGNGNCGEKNSSKYGAKKGLLPKRCAFAAARLAQ